MNNRNDNSNPINNKISHDILKEIENLFCKDVSANNEYHLASQIIPNNRKRKQRYKNANDSIDPKQYNFSNFNVISSLHSSAKLVVYYCSHRHLLPKIIHKSKKYGSSTSKLFDCV